MVLSQPEIGRWRSDGARDRPVVLVVQDDPDSRRIYSQVLWYNGFDVIVASDAQSGYRAARSFRPDLILLDLTLPDVDGLALCGKLRAEGDTIPIVALTARSGVEFGPRAATAGFTAYLERPADPVRVLFATESLIGRAPAPGDGRPPSKSVAE